MLEQPVALAIIARSPNNCVNNLMYGVSPQPEQAPENSNRGCSSCTFFTDVKPNVPFRCKSGNCRKKSQFWRSLSRSGSWSCILSALRDTLLLSLAGQTSTQRRQPVQSSTAT